MQTLQPGTLRRCLAMATAEITRHTPTNRLPPCTSRRALHRKRTAIRTTPTLKCQTARITHRPPIRTARTIRRRWTHTRRSSNQTFRIMSTMRAAQPASRTADPCRIFQSVATAPSTTQGKCETLRRLSSLSLCLFYAPFTCQLSHQRVFRCFFLFSFVSTDLVCTACFLSLPFSTVNNHSVCDTLSVPLLPIRQIRFLFSLFSFLCKIKNDRNYVFTNPRFWYLF